LTDDVSAERRPKAGETAAIILAAGAAARMGQSKQLLAYRGRTLLQHSIKQAIGAGFQPIVVVVGSNSHMVTASIAGEAVKIVHNERWKTGMGSSISAGMRVLLESDEVPEVVAILVADQPLVEAKHLAAMRELLWAAGSSIVAAQYSDTIGVPALFKRELFGALLSLPPEAGARRLLRSSDADVTPFPLPQAAVDIDTPEDFERFISGVAARHRT
jgi:molybdenum cofactor cytidylyltransferase